jgi:hypothetical protein
MAMPREAAIAIGDMLDNVAELKPEQRVLILAHVDGLYGGTNLIDQETVSWIQAAVQMRGAYPAVLWIDEPFRADEWRMPPILRTALAGADIFINNSFDITIEEVKELRQALDENNVVMVRNFATTAPLITSNYALTPSELVAQIRFQAGSMFKDGEPWTLTDPNGTNLSGTISAPTSRMHYTQWRRETLYRPFPEWVHPPITVRDTEGTLVYDRTLSWWSRYVGIPPFFSDPVRLTIERGYITKFDGGEEAKTLRRYLEVLADRFGDEVFSMSALHSGVHPNASVEPHQCSFNPLWERIIEHQHTSNVHFHIGSVPRGSDWPTNMLHITGDIRHATWQVGNVTVMENGRLSALDHPDVLAIAARHPDRPTLPDNSNM